MSRTPWFPRAIKPVHQGLYEVADANEYAFLWWNGKYWTTHETGLQLIWPLPEAWRGLAKKP